MGAEYQETFSPFLWALVERDVPSPIFVVGMTGVSRWLYTPLPTSVQGKSIETQKKIVQKAIKDKHKTQPKSPFGHHVGYVFVRADEEFHEFDIKGNYIGPFNRQIPHLTASARLQTADGDDLTGTIRSN